VTLSADSQSCAHELESINNVPGRGLFLVSETGRIAFVSESARARLASWPLIVRNELLILQDPQSDALFRSSLKRILDQEVDGGVQALYRADEQPPVFLRIVKSTLPKLAIITVRDPLWVEESDMRDIASLFDTTGRESQLALHLARGHSLLQFCENNFLSMNTAKTHLRQVFKKTGVNSQMQLVAVVLAALR